MIIIKKNKELIFMCIVTTGAEPYDNNGNKNHRIFEIGAIKVRNMIPTDGFIHMQINPECDIPPEILKEHKITNNMFKNSLTFKEASDKLLDFIGKDTAIVLHNAISDIRFINAELMWANGTVISDDRITGTLPLARAIFPDEDVSIDELCQKFGISNSHRIYNGTLFEALKLFDIYRYLINSNKLTIAKRIKLFWNSIVGK